VTAAEYEALLAVAPQVHQLFRLALVVVHETGHRSRAVRLLRWADLDLDGQEVRWRAENDKIGYQHETCLTADAVTALRESRRAGGVLSEWVFPGAGDPSQPVSRYVFSEWWQRGAELAKLAAVTGRGWHSLRRQFATELKHVPLKDLAELGGWKNAQTILTCYQQADKATMRQALATRQRLEALA
jgi:integrase